MSKLKEFTLTPYKRGKTAPSEEWYFLYSGVNKSANKISIVNKFKQTYPEIHVKNIRIMKNYDKVIVRFVTDKKNIFLN